MSRLGKCIETANTLVVARGGARWGVREVIAEGSFGGDGNIVKLIAVWVAQLCE